MTDALRRKLGKPPSALEQDGPSVAKVLRSAIEHAGEEIGGLIWTAASYHERRESLADVLAGIADDGPPRLVLRLRGEGGALGLAVCDIPAMSALLEHMVVGQVLRSPPAERRPTATDGALVGEVLDRVLARFDAGAGQIANLPPVTGFRADGVFEDARAVSLAFDEGDYRRIDLTLDFVRGLRSGTLRLILPWERAGEKARRRSRDATWRAAWQQAVKDSPVVLDAVLYRFEMSVDEIARLAVGDALAMPRSAIDAVSLEGGDGSRVAIARLGQTNGMRAVRVRHTGEAGVQPDRPQVLAKPPGTGGADPPGAERAPGAAHAPLAAGAVPEPGPLSGAAGAPGSAGPPAGQTDGLQKSASS